MINKREVETKYLPVKTNSIDEFLRSVERTKMKYQEMLQSDHNDLQGKIVSTDSHEQSSNNHKQISQIENSEPKPGKVAPLEDENGAQMNEIAHNRKLFYFNITLTPSPRIKKRIRREQFLQEHKQM